MKLKNWLFVIFTSLIISFYLLFHTTAFAEEFKDEKLCKVLVCNKLERVTFSITNMIKDEMGETCMETYVPKDTAVVGEVLSSDSRWYQGSFNPTKKSVTRIREVYSCQK